MAIAPLMNRGAKFSVRASPLAPPGRLHRPRVLTGAPPAEIMTHVRFLSITPMDRAVYIMMNESFTQAELNKNVHHVGEAVVVTVVYTQVVQKKDQE